MASDVRHLFRANANDPVRVQSRPQADRDSTQESWPDFRQLKTEVTRILMKNKERSPTSVGGMAMDSSKYADDVQAIVVPPVREDEVIAPPPRRRRVEPIDGDLTARTVEPASPAARETQPRLESQKNRAPQYWPNNQSTKARPRKSDREQHFFQGLFEVTADSLIFDEPRMESALLKTLKPGSQVRVEHKQGNFLLVRSLKDPAMSGYVHLDDAYLKRIQ
jgi:hypothetical protein